MNPLIHRVLGEDDVERHLAGGHAGVPPKGRQYPPMEPATFHDEGGEGAEEKREVQIAKEILKLTRDPQVIALAQELIVMHGKYT